MCLLKIEMGLGDRITLCCSAKTPDGLLFRTEYDGWRKNGINVKERVTQPGAASIWKGEAGRWTAADVFAAANDAAAVYYLCGPNKMVQELRDGLERLGVPASNVRTEKWGDYSDLF
jgi:ferredoxin-NADP reductase